MNCCAPKFFKFGTIRLASGTVAVLSSERPAGYKLWCLKKWVGCVGQSRVYVQGRGHLLHTKANTYKIGLLTKDFNPNITIYLLLLFSTFEMRQVLTLYKTDAVSSRHKITGLLPRIYIFVYVFICLLNITGCAYLVPVQPPLLSIPCLKRKQLYTRT